MKVRRNLPKGRSGIKNNNMQQLISTYRKCDGEFIGYSVIHEVDGEVMVLTPSSKFMIIEHPKEYEDIKHLLTMKKRYFLSKLKTA